ncbi:MAG: hypothetical protein WC867_06595 [Candidatus Pacearchaeota archaeon]|jgi:hypothetical protein
MIGNPKWFKRRKYGGWGLCPITLQGWIYSIIIVAITIAITLIPFNDMKIKIGVIIIWAIFLVVEFGSLMVKINDEREKIHEAFAERNALWAIILVIVIGVAYQSATSSVKGDFSSVDPFLIAAVVIGLIVKAISNFWFERKN